jgi:hypothetical protein
MVKSPPGTYRRILLSTHTMLDPTSGPARSTGTSVGISVGDDDGAAVAVGVAWDGPQPVKINEQKIKIAMNR